MEARGVLSDCDHSLIRKPKAVKIATCDEVEGVEKGPAEESEERQHPVPCHDDCMGIKESKELTVR